MAGAEVGAWVLCVLIARLHGSQQLQLLISRGGAETRRREYAEPPHGCFDANLKELWALWMERSSVLGPVSRPREQFSPRLRTSA
jgi:hypothetical protein